MQKKLTINPECPRGTSNPPPLDILVLLSHRGQTLLPDCFRLGDLLRLGRKKGEQKWIKWNGVDRLWHVQGVRSELFRFEGEGPRSVELRCQG